MWSATAKTTKYQGSFQINSARAYNSSPPANVRTVKDFNEFKSLAKPYFKP